MIKNFKNKFLIILLACIGLISVLPFEASAQTNSYQQQIDLFSNQLDDLFKPGQSLGLCMGKENVVTGGYGMAEAARPDYTLYVKTKLVNAFKDVLDRFQKNEITSNDILPEFLKLAESIIKGYWCDQADMKENALADLNEAAALSFAGIIFAPAPPKKTAVPWNPKVIAALAEEETSDNSSTPATPEIPSPASTDDATNPQTPPPPQSPSSNPPANPPAAPPAAPPPPAAEKPKEPIIAELPKEPIVVAEAPKENPTPVSPVNVVPTVPEEIPHLEGIGAGLSTGFEGSGCTLSQAVGSFGNLPFAAAFFLIPLLLRRLLRTRL